MYGGVNQFPGHRRNEIDTRAIPGILHLHTVGLPLILYHHLQAIPADSGSKRLSMTAPRLPTLALAIGMLLGGCAATGPTSESAPTPSAPEAPPAAEEQIQYGQFSADTLFALLTAEIAGQRNRFDIALNNYLEQAVVTRDAGIIERAMEISEFLGARQQALEMAQLWMEVSPDDPDALRAAALQLARAGQHDDALQVMQRVLELDDDTHFDLLALASLQADSETRAGLLNNLMALLQRHPDNPQLSFAAALLLQEEQRTEEALQLLRKHSGDNPSAASIMLQSRLLAGSGDMKQAISVLQGGVSRFPEDHRLRLLLARMLVNTEDYPEAARHFRELSRQNPEDPEIQLALALIEMESGDHQAAIAELESLLELDPDNSSARYHLGQALALSGQTDAAIEAWRAIRAGEEFLPSRRRMTQLLVEQNRVGELAQLMQDERARYPQQGLELYLLEIEALAPGDPERAMQLSNEALSQFEDSSSLLYTRALLAERLGKPAGLEADLQRILDLEPDNAMALNALGYTLADRNQRLDEALEMIEKAHRLRPEDPAILDSLGWVHYRLGNLELAEELLRRAYAAFPDAEVGAHLGEVLWQLGKHREARDVWDEAAADAEDSSLIDATRERLKAN